VKRDMIMPGVIGEIFDILCGAIGNYNTCKIDLEGKMQRMSDFSIWGESISRAIGMKNMEFIQMYTDRIKLDALDVVNSYPIFQIVQKMMSSIVQYEDTISNFYGYLKNYAVEENIDTKDDKFPKGSHKVREQIKILLPTFRALGFNITLTKNTITRKKNSWGKGVVIIKISKVKESVF